MKKPMAFIVLTSVLTVFFSLMVQAAATIDKANAANGTVAVTLADLSGKTIKAQVEKGGEKYVYTLTKSCNLPLQMGAGDYKIAVLEGVGGDKYKPLVTETVSVAAINEKELYKASIPLVDYASSKTAIPAYKTLTNGKTSEGDKLAAVYDDIVKNYSYDTAKATSVKSDYVPVIDTIYSAKKGICYDYASLLGGVLRSQGIPTRLVMGYVPEIKEYHAWNEVFTGGKWITVDATYDAQVVKAGRAYTMEKDKSKTKVLKTY